MSKRIVFLNVFLTLLDFLICLSVIAAFAFCGYHFSHWWINLFSLIPLALFDGHKIILEDYAEEREGGDKDA